MVHAVVVRRDTSGEALDPGVQARVLSADQGEIALEIAMEGKNTYTLGLPAPNHGAGWIEVKSAEGQTLAPRRSFPEGIIP